MYTVYAIRTELDAWLPVLLVLMHGLFRLFIAANTPAPREVNKPLQAPSTYG